MSQQSSVQTMSDQGIQVLEEAEGVVLKTYRDIVGVKTIGAGLTAASGVIVPKMGMTLTAAEARKLLKMSLRRNYEPRVRKALGRQPQNVFDGAVMFDFNTGGIHRASWVDAWKRGDIRDAERRFKMWVKASGRRVQGLINRRNKEWRIIEHADYGRGRIGLPVDRSSSVAQFVFPQGARAVPGLETEASVIAALEKLGYATVTGSNYVLLRDDVRNFQRNHDLTVDGIVGPATLNTIQRQLDARRALAAPAATSAAGGTVTVAQGAESAVATPDWVGPLVLGLALLWALWALWRYRDWVAARIQRVLPGVARWLRAR